MFSEMAEIIKEKDKYLAEIIKNFEEMLFIDSYTVILKGRTMAERIARNIIAAENIKENEDFVDVSCMMSERYDLRCTKEKENNKVELLRIPFDKVKYFDNFERIDNRNNYYEEEKYNYINSNIEKEDNSEVKNITENDDDNGTTYEKLCELISGVWRYDNLRVDFTQKIITKEGERVRLGKKQMEILKILVYNKGNIISREQLIQYVWYTDEVNDRTVDAHISKIRRELGLTCIKSVPGYGYRLEC